MRFSQQYTFHMHKLKDDIIGDDKNNGYSDPSRNNDKSIVRTFSSFPYFNSPSLFQNNLQANSLNLNVYHAFEKNTGCVVK